jgi:hypothetical protein
MEAVRHESMQSAMEEMGFETLRGALQCFMEACNFRRIVTRTENDAQRHLAQ